MKKSNVWFLLIPVIISISILVGFFIYRITSVDALTVEKNVDATESTRDPNTTGRPVNINTAGVEILTELPGIGEALAKRIVDYRTKNGPFSDIRDLLNVSGIGESKLDIIKDYLWIGDTK